MAMSEALKSARDWLRWRRAPESWLLRATSRLDEAAEDAGEVVAALEIDHGRDVARVEAVGAGLGFFDGGDGEQGGAFEVLSLGEDLEVLAGDGDGLLAGVAVLIAEHLQLRVEARADAATMQCDVEAAGALLRKGEVEDAADTAVAEALVEEAGAGGGVGGGDVEEESVGEDAAGVGDGERAFAEGGGVELEVD